MPSRAVCLIYTAGTPRLLKPSRKAATLEPSEIRKVLTPRVSRAAHQSAVLLGGTSCRRCKSSLLQAQLCLKSTPKRGIEAGRSGLSLRVMAPEQPSSKAEYDQRWHSAWQNGVPPGQKWDVGKCAPAFSQFLDSGFLSIEGKAAYVPGCGRGYDVVELAKRGANATGLDLAPESIEEAKRYSLEQNVSNAPGTAHYVSGDYFTFKTDAPWVDLGYDFTFFCALHPNMRQHWASTWGKVIRPGGFLVTLEFPIRLDDKSGPPWPVNPQLYMDYLAPQGFRQVYQKDVDKALLSHPNQDGAEVLACWQKI